MIESNSTVRGEKVLNMLEVEIDLFKYFCMSKHVDTIRCFNFALILICIIVGFDARYKSEKSVKNQLNSTSSFE